MSDKLIDEAKQIERYGCTVKDLEAEYGSMTSDQLLQMAWAWAGDVIYSADNLSSSDWMEEKQRIIHAAQRTRWLIGTARKFQKEQGR